jgi:hypothetical protein
MRITCRFTLRSLFLFITGLCLLLAWAVARHGQATRQERAVRTLQSAGAVVIYDYQYDPSAWNSFNDAAAAPGPRWVRDQLGIDFLARPAGVVFRERRDAGGDVEEALQQLTSLKLLAMNSTRLSEPGLRNLRGTELQEVSLFGRGVTDVSLESVYRMARLERLNLTATRVTDVGMMQLCQLSSLSHLYILGSPAVTDEGLRHIGRLRSLDPNQANPRGNFFLCA